MVEGSWPKTITCSVTPSDQTSATLPWYSPCPHTSGAVYVGVPGEPSVESSHEAPPCCSMRETPKSEMTALPG